MAVSLLDRIPGDARIFLGGEQGGGRSLLFLALDDVGAAALHDEFAEIAQLAGQIGESI